MIDEDIKAMLERFAVDVIRAYELRGGYVVGDPSAFAEMWLKENRNIFKHEQKGYADLLSRNATILAKLCREDIDVCLARKMSDCANRMVGVNGAFASSKKGSFALQDLVEVTAMTLTYLAKMRSHFIHDYLRAVDERMGQLIVELSAKRRKENEQD